MKTHYTLLLLLGLSLLRSENVCAKIARKKEDKRAETQRKKRKRNVYIIGVSLVAAAILFFIIKKGMNRDDESKQEEEEQKPLVRSKSSECKRKPSLRASGTRKSRDLRDLNTEGPPLNPGIYPFVDDSNDQESAESDDVPDLPLQSTNSRKSVNLGNKSTLSWWRKIFQIGRSSNHVPQGSTGSSFSFFGGY